VYKCTNTSYDLVAYRRMYSGTCLEGHRKSVQHYQIFITNWYTREFL